MFWIIILGMIIAVLAGFCHYLYEEHYDLDGELQFLFYPTIVLIIMFGIIEVGQIFKCIIDYLCNV